MKRFKTIAISLVAATLIMTAVSSPSHAQPMPTHRAAPAVTESSTAEPMSQCWRRLGPFATQYRAYQVRGYYQSRGLAVGPVYGQGGVIARGGRSYYFRVYYRC